MHGASIAAVDLDAMDDLHHEEQSSCDGPDPWTTGDGSGGPEVAEADGPTEEAVQRAAALLFLKIGEGHRIPQSVMEEIVAIISSLYALAFSAIKQKVRRNL